MEYKQKSMNLTAWLCLACLCTAHALRVGVGIADVTGPPAEIGFMGYAQLEQVGHGIHLRQFSRAFVLEDDSGNSTQRIVFVSVDAAMMGQGVRREVLKRLQKRYGDMYSEQNVIISGTHTHSTPGGFLMDFLFDLPILGFVKETYSAYILGIYKSIVIAHTKITKARMEYGEAEILDANINRSPTSYLRNPAEERAKYKYDTDKTLAQVRFITPEDKILGVINWFAVHPTSMNNTNKLISSDNVGYASVLCEKALNGNKTLPGKGSVVCAFASTNLGDVSPNTRGPRCEHSGTVCDQESKLCPPKEKCFASGPGRDMFESTKIIAGKLFDTALKLLNEPGEDLTGTLGIVHQYVNMPTQEVFPFDPLTETFNSSSKVQGCLPAMGYSFAAGTTDGPGAFDFTQGTTTSNPLWNAVRDFIAEPTDEDVKCQAPKPILLATGRAKFPYEWQPHIVSCAVARIGGLMIAAVPGEFTTMSGRRLRSVIAKSAPEAKRVVLAGLSNIYSDYVATPEEYQAQRYEAASTIFGPHTLDIYLNKYVELTAALISGQTPEAGPNPPDFSNQLITLVPPVLWDAAPWRREFGDCTLQPQRQYSYGDVVTASFISGHPRNSIRHGRWYMTVEKLESEEDDAWVVVATDAEWETKYIWVRDSKFLGTSHVDLEWEIPVGMPTGTYRLHHYAKKMAISLVGKLVIIAVCLAVAGGMGVTIYLIVNDDSTDSAQVTEEPPTTVPTVPGPDPPTSDLLYEVGVGIADMTGPCVEIAFMGYAEVSQTGKGIHLRQFARSFIFSKGGTRIVLVAAEVQSVGIAVRREVVNNLQARYGEIYSLRNVILTGTHTHSTPGGYLVDFLLDISILGFSRETFNAYVDGITRSIIRAHENMVPARLEYATSTVSNAHKNRSPFSYEYNPEVEKNKYNGNTDDTLTQLRVIREDGQLHGVLNWFAVHTTSMNMSNHLVSSDNLGFAALRMEMDLNPGLLAGKAEVVAGFFASNLGDVSPNLKDAQCEFSGNYCDNQFFICGAGERCYSEGPGDDMFESVRIIGETVYEGAMEALKSPGEELRGNLAVVHQFVEMPAQVVPKYDPITGTFDENNLVKGCVPAMGYSFASGTIDGANTLNITQGTLEGNDLLDVVSGVLAEPTEDDNACHFPKPILLATGRANFPLPWHPRTVSITAIWLADLLVLGVPGEPTTMAGRRMRAAAGDVMRAGGFPEKVVVSGLTNEYIHYVSTWEEYQVQRYESASTIYGPNTLDIFLNKFVEFTKAAIEGAEVPPGPTPVDYRGQTLSLITPVVFDGSPRGAAFGDVLQQPPETVRRGDTVTATFVGANPRNDLRQETGYAVVERLELSGWNVIANDADWDTKFHWQRTSTILGTSQVTFEWKVPADALLTSYRIRYNGASRGITGAIRQFTGVSNAFTINDST